MTDKDFEKMNRLNEIAEGDYAYIVWAKSREQFAQAFEDYVSAQPEDIRNMLLGYAGAGDMMWQRKVNLACMHMTFLDQGKE